MMRYADFARALELAPGATYARARREASTALNFDTFRRMLRQPHIGAPAR